MSTYRPQVVIIGAGPAGCSCAISLIKRGIADVRLIDNNTEKKFHIGESISPEMNPVLRQLGVIDRFKDEGHEPCYGSCSYWGSAQRGYNDFLLSPFGHGWHLDRAHFNRFLQEEAARLGAFVHRSWTFVSQQREDQKWAIKIKNSLGTSWTLAADVVIDASGKRAVFAKAMGSKKTNETSLLCLALRFKGKGDLNLPQLTHLESVPEGWWYAARIPNRQLLVTLYTDAETSKTQALNKLPNWIQALQRTPQTSKWIQHLEPMDDSVLGYNAEGFVLDKAAGKGWMAIGDAASSYDPITAQGIIKAMTQGQRAAEYIAASEENGLNFMAFSDEIAQQHQAYIEAMKHFYGLEQRWPESSFWKSVHSK